MDRGQPLKRFLRVRPAAPGDGQIVPGALVLDEEAKTVLVVSPGRIGRGQEVPVDGLFGPDRNQEEVWAAFSAVIPQLGQGKNATVALYGVTGSGKTYTMEGTRGDPGLSPRAVQAVLELPNLDKLEMSYVEIHNAGIYDLLHHHQQKLDIRTIFVQNKGRPNEREKFVIPNITVETIATAEEFAEKFKEAATRRKTGSTRLNKTSSRSHGVLMLSLSLTDMVTGQPLHAQLKLVDMAGCEDNRKTGNSSGVQMRESSAINTSLFNLKEVIKAIHTGQKPPFRNSPLTRILQDCLGGDSLGYLMCCLAPGSNFASDTYNTVSFIAQAGSVRNTVAVNRVLHVPSPQMPAKAALPTPRAIRVGPGSLGQPVRPDPKAAAGLPLRPKPTVALRSVDQNVAAPRTTLSSRPSTLRLGVNASFHPRSFGQVTNQPDPQSAKLASDNSKLRADVANLILEQAKKDTMIDRLNVEIARLTKLVPKHPVLTIPELKAVAYVSVEAARECERGGNWAGALEALKRTYSIAPMKHVKDRMDKIEQRLAAAAGQPSGSAFGPNCTLNLTNQSIRDETVPATVATTIRA